VVEVLDCNGDSERSDSKMSFETPLNMRIYIQNVVSWHELSDTPKVSLEAFPADPSPSDPQSFALFEKFLILVSSCC
jgi:hypothetical protein